MNILLVNNLGTILYTIFFGKEVGIDSLGNRYYISKKKFKKKWVVYNKTKDPTAIPVKWQLWLTSEDEKVIDKDQKYTWEKDRKRNLTGTNQAYHPVRKINEPKKSVQKKNKYWTPN